MQETESPRSKSEYEGLIKKGWRIVRWNQRRRTIEIANRRGFWSWMDQYSDKRWSEITSNERTLVEDVK